METMKGGDIAGNVEETRNSIEAAFTMRFRVEYDDKVMRDSTLICTIRLSLHVFCCSAAWCPCQESWSWDFPKFSSQWTARVPKLYWLLF